LLALLDTHVLLWWMADDPRLSARAREVLADRKVRLLWSAASTWELAIKASLGKVTLPEPVGAWVQSRAAQQAIELLPVTHHHAAEVERLPSHHRDPFDRLLVAQARTEGAAIVSGDPFLRKYDVEVVW
jgi:PIN domain nuclease of toxin-antitoxin system